MDDDQQQQGNGGGKFPTPPYIAYKTLQTLLGDLKAHGLPPQIDRSVLTRFSGGVQGQLMIALRVLGLLDDKNVPTAKLASLVSAYETDAYKEHLKALVQETYPYVMNIGLTTATPSMFTKAFSDATGAGEESLRKCRAFFLAAARDAGIDIGARIEKAKFPRGRAANGRKPKPKPVGMEQVEGERPPPPPAPTAVITEKLLEYRLVDLMSDAAGDPETMAAIIKVITFLKTRETEAKTATGQ
jgi:hypothetical protein